MKSALRGQSETAEIEEESESSSDSGLYLEASDASSSDSQDAGSELGKEATRSAGTVGGGVETSKSKRRRRRRRAPVMPWITTGSPLVEGPRRRCAATSPTHVPTAMNVHASVAPSTCSGDGWWTLTAVRVDASFSPWACCDRDTAVATELDTFYSF